MFNNRSSKIMTNPPRLALAVFTSSAAPTVGLGARLNGVLASLWDVLIPPAALPEATIQAVPRETWTSDFTGSDQAAYRHHLNNPLH
jgi:hypothetical protein